MKKCKMLIVSLLTGHVLFAQTADGNNGAPVKVA